MQLLAIPSLLQTVEAAENLMRKKKFRTTGFSHNKPELIAKAKARARALHMSFSGYVVQLIEMDLGQRRKVVQIRPSPNKRKVGPAVLYA